jgi:predicted kinase
MGAIVIRGPLAAGKTTIALALIERLEGSYVSFDRIMEEHGLDQAEEGGGIPAANFLKGNALAVAEVRDALDAGAPVVFDGCFYHLGQLEDLVARLPDGAEVFTLKASLETCVARDRGRARSYGPDAAAAVHWMVSQFDYGTCIDTEGKTVDQVVAEIWEVIEGADDESVQPD